jgi:Fe-S-cluster containining protein
MDESCRLGYTGGMVISQELAYRGAMGEKRAAFCRDYLARKQIAFVEIHNSQRQAVARNGEAISCHRDCSTCCLAYMQAGIPECEAIVYYLYHHEGALKAFLANYPSWRAGLRDRGDIFQECGRLWELKSRPDAGLEIVAALGVAEKRYQEQGLYCPFLAENTCVIYQARPLTCAALVATTPSDRCHPASPCRAKTYVTSTPAMFENSFYYGQFQGNILAFMPLAVNHILQDGYRFLDQIPGLEGLAEASQGE